MKHEFVHCHLHSEFSLLDGASKVKDIVATASEKEMKAIALTDHAVMYGAIDFYKRAKEAGIKPLIGCEVYVAPKSRHEKTIKGSNHLILIAQNEHGYKNLTKLVSAAYLEGFYYKPRIDHELISQHSEGLIALSACLSGEVAAALVKVDYEQAHRAASFYKEVFNDNFYLEIQDHGLSEQRRINPGIVKIARDLDIKLVATNDSHYTKKEDALAREILTCIQSGRRLEDNKYRLESEEHYIKSPEEMYQVFHEIPDALKNSVEIAEKCNLILSMGKSILPHFPLPPGHTAESYMQKIAMEGLKRRYKELTPEVTSRFFYELEIINKMGFPAYFLIVWDYINFSRKKGIQVGPGRGSAAGSIVAYALGITDIDPLPFNLLFERFLNPERISMPDVDTDFCIDRRGEVIQYVTEKYGAKNVSQIVTLGTLGAKQVIKDVSKVLGYTVSESERLSKMIPKGVSVKLREALEDGQELQRECAINPRTKEIVDLALKLEGIARHSSIHAAGVVISKDPLDTIVPLQKTNDGQVIAQYQMMDLEKLGLLKMDFLGLRNLTMIAKSLEVLEKTRGIKLDLNNLGFDDVKTFELLTSGETIGVFQLESSGMQKLVKDLKPNVFEEIIALIALYRPGPLGSGMVEDFVERKHKRRPVTYPHPTIEGILKDTYGLIIYQEQIMQISQIIAGYTLGQADILRKAMGKKDLAQMIKQREIFLEGSAKKGIDSELSNNLFDTMEKFAEYGFNKSHSAAYAVITYRTAYLKANFPIEYMTALISSIIGNPDKVPLYISEARKMGIKILPPDVNTSEAGFSVYNDSILVGLKAVKGVGDNVITAIIEARNKQGQFKSLYDFCKKVDSSVLSRKAVDCLIRAGAFDSLNKNRNQLLTGMEETYASAIKKQKDESSGQTSLFGFVDSESDSGSFEEAPQLPFAPFFSYEENLNIEKEVLGIYVSGHPLDKYTNQLERFCTHYVCDVTEVGDGISVTIGGIITNLRTMLTKKMDTMAVFSLEDLTGSIDVIAYPENLNKFKEFLIKDSKVLISGKLNAKEEEVKIILNSVTLLASIPYLEIKVVNEISMIKLVSMRSILQEQPGDTPVILNYHDSGVEIITGKEYWVSPKDNLIERLKQMFGNESINILN